jgi:hypothetical protein
MLRTRSYTDANVLTSSECHLSNRSISSIRYSGRADSLIETENRIPVRDARAGFYTTSDMAATETGYRLRLASG